MSASMRGAVCYVLLFVLPILYAANDPTLNDVLTALEKMVSFYKVTHSEMNLDGIYGLRVLEGQILLLLMEYEKGRHQHLPLSVVARLHMLHQRARNVSERSLPFLANQDKAYYNKLRPLVEKPFMVAHEYRRVDLTLRWIQTEKQRREVPFDEEFSDRCMAELMGTERTDGRTCIMSPQCLDAMFIRGTGEYQITHQLIYMMLVEQENCVAALNQWLRANGWPGGMSQLYLEFCSNNMVEMQQQMSALDGVPIPIYQDLFMEQQFVCPVLGFMEFLHMDWLRQILSWQKLNGCFGRMPVTDFARNYKDMHQLDYQYEGDSPGTHRPPQAGHQEQTMRQQQQQQQRNQYDQHPPVDNRIPSMAAANRGSYVDKESAVIQQSDKLQLVGGTVNNNSSNRNIKVPQGGAASLPKGSKQRQMVKRSAVNTDGTQGDDYSMNSAKSKADSRGRKQKQISKKPRLNQQQKQSTHQGMESKVSATGQHTDINRKRVKQRKRIGSPRKESNSEVYLNEETPVLNDDQRTNIKTGGWSILGKDFSPYNGKQQQGEFLIRRLQRLKQPNAPSHFGARRRLLVERDLVDNCLSHKTAVAAGALSQYLRFLVNPGTPEFRSHYRLDGTNFILNPAALRPPPNTKQGIILHDGQKKKSSVIKMSKAGKAPKRNNDQGAVGGAQRKGQQKQPRAASRRGKQGSKTVLKAPGGGGGVMGRGQQQELVVPRPHPDDMIHSEANENAAAAAAAGGVGDVEDTHPQDYYDPDEDQDEEDDDQEHEEEANDGPEESYDNKADPPGRPAALHHHAVRPPPGADLPKLSLHHARFRHMAGAGGGAAGDVFDRRVGVGVGDTNKGDEEYEQYVDDEEDQGDGRVQKIDLLNPPRRAGGPARRIVINVPAGETAREAHHDEDTYSYYDKEDSVMDPPPAAPIQQRRVKLAPPHAYRAPRRTQRPPVRPKGSSTEVVGEKLIGAPPHPGVNPPGRIYMVLFCVMILLLVFMYRFVRKRRIVIRYPRTGFR